MNDVETHREKISELRWSRPFRPVSIDLKSGEHYEMDEWNRFTCSGDKLVLILPRLGVRMFHLSQVQSVGLATHRH